MPSTYATTLNTKFSTKLIQRVYERSIIDQAVNRDYEGEVKDKTSILKITSLYAPDWGAYTTGVTYTDTSEVVGTLTTDQQYYVAPKFRDISKFKSAIKDPENPIMKQLSEKLQVLWDTYVLSFADDVAAGNRVGTNYTTGTVTITTVTGAVVGSGTTFTAGMVGKGFKATGHTKWYRVKTFTDSTNIVIENDSDDETSSYDGGAISGGTAYVLQANTVLAVSTSNFMASILSLKQVLDEAEVPMEDRSLFLPHTALNTMARDSQIKISVPAAYEALVVKGFVTELVGFKIFGTNRLTGNNTTGYRCLAIHTNWLTFAEGMAEGPETLRLESDFATGYRELHVWGAKVVDERRKFAAELYATFS
jgi:hypothetical protein